MRLAVAAALVAAADLAGARPAAAAPQDDPDAGVPAVDAAPETAPGVETETVPETETAPETETETEPEAEAPWETKLRWTGYVDIGLFDASGDGAGHVQDVGHVIFPQYRDVGWVFHGDPLATAVNSRGEPADTGDVGGPSRALTFDSVDSHGKPTFLVNEVDLDLTVAPHPRVWILVSADLMPRGRNVSRPEGIQLGDFVDVDLAFADWTVRDDGGHVVDLQVGKFDSVMGIEYRVQESPDRFGVTPSLIFRYGGGHPTGVKARARLWDDAVNAAVAVTNGSHFVELFPFADEQDHNVFKTVAGRLAYHREGDDTTVEIGGSGLYGAQDQQPDDDVRQWQVGADLDLVWRDLELRAEYVRGHAPGKTDEVPCDVAPCLRFQGAYGEVSYRVLNWVGFLARADWRDADHRAGDEFLYVVDLLRVTGGVRVELERFAILKAEYLHNHELLGRLQIPNDVATSSLVLFF